MSSDDMDERTELAKRLHSAAIHVLRYARKADAPAGLSPARLSAMSVLVFRGPTTLTELAALEQVKAPTMTRLVTALEKARLVNRRAHERDQRMQTIHATKKGEALLRAAQARRVQLIAALLAGFDRNALDCLKLSVERLEAALAEAVQTTRGAAGPSAQGARRRV